MSELEFVHTEGAPQAIGPYSQAVVVGDDVYCSGQVALDPATMQMVGGGDVAAEAEQVLTNLAAVLKQAGSGMERVVKTTVYLVTMDDFATVNEIYARHFGEHRPARACVAVAELPKGARVEVDCVARRS